MTKLILCDFPAKTGLDGWSSFSPFVLEIDRALRLAKLPYEREYVGYAKIKKLNPTGQLPVLVVDGENVADSTRILLRIEALAPGLLTGGLDARGQAEAWLWEEFADTSLYPYVLAARWADDRGWPIPREAFFGAMPAPVRMIVAPLVRRGTIQKLVGRDFLRGGIEACYERFDRVLAALDARAPDDGFWLGARPSVADLGLFAHLHSLQLPGLEFMIERMRPYARLLRWLDRVDTATS